MPESFCILTSVLLKTLDLTTFWLTYASVCNSLCANHGETQLLFKHLSWTVDGCLELEVACVRLWNRVFIPGYDFIRWCHDPRLLVLLLWMLIFLCVVDDKVVFVLDLSVRQAGSTPDELKVLWPIIIIKALYDLPEPSHHVFLYLDLLRVILVAVWLACVVLNFSDILELFDFETGASTDALLDIL